MKAFVTALVPLLVVVGAQARTYYPDTPIRESTDPARIAAIERHAAQLRAQNERGAVFGSGTAAPYDTSTQRQRRHARADRR